MTDRVTRRDFVKAASTSATLAAAGAGGLARGDDSKPAQPGKIVAEQQIPQVELVPGMTIGRMLLGGNLLTHYTHSRDLRYVYTLAARYNTKEKIFETMAIAEAHGVNAVVIHTAAGVVDWLQEYRNKHGGKMKWIICPTANITDDMKEYTDACKMLRDIGTDSIYLWGVRGDQLSGLDLRGNPSTPRPDLMAKAVEAAKNVGLPAGVGGHRLGVIKCCEENDISGRLLHQDFALGRLSQRQHQSRQPLELHARRDHRVHEGRQEAVDRLQGHGGRGPHAARGIHLRLPERRRLLPGRRVRLRDRGRRRHHERGARPAGRDQPPSPLDCLKKVTVTKSR